MPDARNALLERIIEEVAVNGLADRSLREIADAVGSSHRMLLYHFESRAGLVSAIVERVESNQRDALMTLSAETNDPAELIRLLWAQVSASELRPFVRLFYECVALTGGEGLTDPWLQTGTDVAESISAGIDADLLRLGVAVTRGLLIDTLGSGDAKPATRSLERFIELLEARPSH
jgi:AcrR family transcriptional regulator